MAKLTKAQRSARMKAAWVVKKEAKRRAQDERLGQVNYAGATSGRISSAEMAQANHPQTGASPSYEEGMTQGRRYGFQDGMEAGLSAIQDALRSLVSSAIYRR